MKINLPASRRVPVNFGNEEPVCSVPVHGRRLTRRLSMAIAGTSRCDVSVCTTNAGPKAIKAVSNHRTTIPPLLAGEGTGLSRHSVATADEGQSLAKLPTSKIRNHKSAFTLVEILVVLVLLSMIVLALMAVFSGIQRAFRASLTQADTLEGGRAVMDMIASDLQLMTPSYSYSNIQYSASGFGVVNGPALQVLCPVNFSAQLTPKFFLPPSPLYQPLLSSPSGSMRTNLLENIFILSKGNINGTPTWIGTGYSVNTNLADGTLYPLYRFYQTTNAAYGAPGMWGMYSNFVQFNYTNSTQWSHLMDGVINLTAMAYDTNGVSITNGYTFPLAYHEQNVFSLGSPYLGVSQFIFCSNAIPASVQIELATIEDRVMVHAESLGGVSQSNYLSNSAGQVHIFRQRVWIPNVDLSAYQ